MQGRAAISVYRRPHGFASNSSHCPRSIIDAASYQSPPWRFAPEPGMELDSRAAFYYRVANAPVLAYPFPHFYLESVFPDAFYRELQAGLPPLDPYMPIADSGTVRAETFPQRFILDTTTL